MGIEVARGPRRLSLYQCKYILKIVEESGPLGSMLSLFPMEDNHKLALAKGRVLDDRSWYRRLVRRLIYLIITRPKLCYAIHILSYFMQSPKEEHMDAAHCVLRYLKGTPGYGILLQCDCDLHIHAYIMM